MNVAYLTYANLARTAEQEHRFTDAAHHWKDASRFAGSSNKEYCKNRIEFCQKHHIRLQSLPASKESSCAI